MPCSGLSQSLLLSARSTMSITSPGVCAVGTRAGVGGVARRGGVVRAVAAGGRVACDGLGSWQLVSSAASASEGVP